MVPVASGGVARTTVAAVRAHKGQVGGLLLLVGVTVAMLATFASFRVAAGDSILRRQLAVIMATHDPDVAAQCEHVVAITG